MDFFYFFTDLITFHLDQAYLKRILRQPVARGFRLAHEVQASSFLMGFTLFLVGASIRMFIVSTVPYHLHLPRLHSSRSPGATRCCSNRDLKSAFVSTSATYMALAIYLKVVWPS